MLPVATVAAFAMVDVQPKIAVLWGAAILGVAWALIIVSTIILVWQETKAQESTDRDAPHMEEVIEVFDSPISAKSFSRGKSQKNGKDEVEGS